ncbi:MAG: DUF3792 family protein [Clostridiales bacterium]|nr:DUF3792 family protein [Clostridiales bacterium]
MQIFTSIKYPLRVIAAGLISSLTALILLFTFSAIIYFTGASDWLLRVINLLVRIFAVAVCVFLCMPQSKGILYGGIAGLVTAIFMQFTFLALSAKFSVSEFLINGLFCVIFGAIFGIIWVNLKNRAKST